MSIFETIINHFNGQMDAISGHTEALTPYIAEAAHLLAHTLLEGNKILCCSAGSSFAIAQHFCSELDSLNSQRPALPCILLGNSQSLAAAMDQEEHHQYYSRQLNALGQSGDTVLLLSQSGQEKSLLHAIQTANSRALSLIIINSGSHDLSATATGNHVNISLRNLSKAQSLAMQFLTISTLADLTEQLLFGNLE